MSATDKWKVLARRQLSKFPPELVFLSAVVTVACVTRVVSLWSAAEPGKDEEDRSKGGNGKARQPQKSRKSEEVGGGTKRRRRANPRDAATIRVCFSTGSAQSWREVVEEYERTSVLPDVQLLFGVLLECDDVEDVRLYSADDMRHTVAISHAVRMKNEEKAKAARRLVRRFVNGMESIVVLADRRVRPDVGWDEALLWCSLPLDGRSMYTCPASAKSDPSFPTIRTRSNGAVVRSDERAFRNPDLRRRDVVPSACWCAEFLAAPPSAVLAWSASKEKREAFRYFVPAFPFLRASTKGDVEAFIVENEDCPLLLGGRSTFRKGSDAATPSDRVGLSSAPTTLEMRRKFGSVDAAKIAVSVESKAR